MDRCDTPATYFVFTGDGRPYFYAVKDPRVFAITKQIRRQAPGQTLEVRDGNYAAATMDELRTCWIDQDIKIINLDPLVVIARPIDLA